MIEEMRVETSNFDAAQGHGTGGTIAMMTRAGSNSLRGTANYQYLDEQDQFAEPAAEAGVLPAPGDREDLRRRLRELHRDDARRPGRHSAADRRPQQAVLLRQLPAQLRQRAGAEHADEHDPRQREAPQRRLLRPARAAERRPVPDLRSADGAAGSGAPRQPDPHAVPEQHHPARSVHEPERHLQEPAVRALQGHGPARRTRTSSSRARRRPTTTTRAGFPTRSPRRTSADAFDYNHSGSDRFFFRASGTTFYEYNVDWTYETKYAGLHSNDKTRASWSYTGNWTKVHKSLVIDTQLSANRFYEDQQRRGLHKYKPTDVGLPAYLDEYCLAREQLHAADDQHHRLPERVEPTPTAACRPPTSRRRATVTSVRGTHTLRGGIDYRLAMRQAGLMAAGNVSSTYNFDNLYTRAADTTSGLPGQQHRARAWPR